MVCRFSGPADPKPDFGVPMDLFRCETCDYIYDPKVGDPDGGIDPGVPFSDLPDDWTCPMCGVEKDEFVRET